MALVEGNKVELTQVVSRDPEVHSGDLVFAGTRVPVEILVAFLSSGSSIEEFLESFPTVERWQVESFLEYSLAAIDHLLLESSRAA
ncbi:MAG: DUF433 domain-containing protein [Caldilineaceae bacterium SB0668_bin_21]|nr:DUF433 domain-containing protein [Caldilineaceae bacterium SB0668_bin_21]MYC21863.1 DUF433 domain-containing protein [Caldilineaceae bacterium SB0662_bin_25]